MRIPDRANAAKRRLVQPTRIVGASLSPTIPCFELPATAKYLQKNKGARLGDAKSARSVKTIDLVRVKALEIL